MSHRVGAVAGVLAAISLAVGVALAAQAAASVWSGIYSADQADRGRRLYVRDCAQCHGATLLGAEGGSALVGRTFLSPWEKKSVGELFDQMRKTMPDAAPGSLSDRQYLDLLAYLLRENAFPVGQNDLPSTLAALNAIPFAKP
jgi:mono/diheme cytochrome c family protein